LVKLLAEESGSQALEIWLNARVDTRWLTSDLSRVEVMRACRRRNTDMIPAARRLLSGLDFIPLTADVVEQAGLVGPAILRSLDAIHLASALSIGDELSAFVAYDRRLQAAAQDANLPVTALT
jgi:predicted nucleic acid-binding protein